MIMTSQFNDKVVVVTGSSSGIGEDIATAFAAKGAKVTLCGRDQDRLRRVYDKIVKVSGGDKGRLLIISGDITDQKVRKQIIDQTVEKFGRLDILVPNAGVSLPDMTFQTATEETYNLIMDTNLKSVFFLIQQAIPHLEKTKGNIVNISSACTNIVDSMTPIYNITKISLDYMTRSLALDLALKGIRVNSVNPALIITRIFRNYEGDATIIKETAPTAIAKLSLNNRILTLDDVTQAVMFLASDAASYITGETLRVDGGLTFYGSGIWSTKKWDE